MSRNTVTVHDRAIRISESMEKIRAPFALDPELCLYSPQDNLDSLQHPRISDWLSFVEDRWQPEAAKADRVILLMMPCTKAKPYPCSSEHRHINQRLLDEGFKPMGRDYFPQELQAKLAPNFSQDVLNFTALTDGKGTIIHRAVISEPMAFVPYDHIMTYEGKESPATAYDDPGLFEKRGNAVSPWRADSTATQISPTKWAWGDNEKRAYVEMHNLMAASLAKVMQRLGHLYTDRIAWVAPGLTHRSFVLGADERAEHNVTKTRRIGGETLKLIGANDHLDKSLQIEALPTTDDCKDAIRRLAIRLGTDERHVGGTYSRGGTDATPLALPELLDVLVTRLSGRKTQGLAA